MTVVIVEDLPRNATKICFMGDPGPNGWCRVKHMDSKLDYSDTSDWGYCRSNCLGDMNDKDESVMVRLLPIYILSEINSKVS